MKKILAILAILFLIIIFSLYALKINRANKVKLLGNYNREYESYLNKIIYGTDLATLINKATNSNEQNQIKKDKQNYYIENNENSIKIHIKLLFTEKTYPMEEIYNNNTAEFVKFFNTEKFKCVKIEHHEKTGKISKMIFEQQEN